MTESSGACISKSIDDFVTGDVGGPRKFAKFRLMDLPEMGYFSYDKPYPRGELMIKGPCVFQGYF